jgi:hypothetical protein
MLALEQITTSRYAHDFLAFAIAYFRAGTESTNKVVWGLSRNLAVTRGGLPESDNAFRSSGVSLGISNTLVIQSVAA